MLKSQKKNRLLSLNDLRRELNLGIVSRQTISNYLNKKGIRSRIAKSESLLNDGHIQSRLNFVENYINKPDEFWMDVVFVDEKTFQSYKNGRMRIRIGDDEDKNDPMFKVIKDKSIGFSLNLFGYVSSKGCGIYRIDNLNRFDYLEVLQQTLSVINDLHSGNI